MQSNSAAREVRIEEIESEAFEAPSAEAAPEPLAAVAAPTPAELPEQPDGDETAEFLDAPAVEDAQPDEPVSAAAETAQPDSADADGDVEAAEANAGEDAGPSHGFAAGFLAANAGAAPDEDGADDEAEPMEEPDDDRPSAVVTLHPRADRNQHLRIVEAALFAASEPVDVAHLKTFLPDGADVVKLLADLQANYANRGVNLVEVAGKWLFRTAEDLGYILRREQVEQRKLSKAAMETLAIIAYHQPVTRAEIEDIRGVAISKGTLDMLLEIGWVRMRGRRKTPGRPVTYGTTEAFLSHFGLAEVSDLPGLQELKGAGLLEANLPPGFDIPMPKAGDELTPDEEPLDGTEEAFQPPLEMHMPDPSEPPQGGGNDES